MGSKKHKRLLKSPKQKKKKKAKEKSPTRSPTSTSAERREQMRKKANQLAKQHKQKLLDAKLARQKQRNQHLMRTQQRVRMQLHQAGEQGEQQDEQEKIVESGMAKEDRRLMAKHLAGDGCCKRFLRRLEYFFASLLYFLTVPLLSERTFDWLVFLANNLGLYQEYEINDYGQRLSPRTGRPVLLSLGPIRVVQVVESANQVRSHWDPYIREYLKESKLTTDCWRANRMALQVALCMDELGNMYDMPISGASKTYGKKA